MQEAWAFMKTSYGFIFVDTKVRAISECGSLPGVLDVWGSSRRQHMPTF